MGVGSGNRSLATLTADDFDCGAATGFSNHTLKPAAFLLQLYYTLYTYP